MFKIKFQSDDLQRALNVLSKVVNGKNSMPILDCVHFTFVGKDILLEGSDGLTYIKTTIPCEIEEGQPDSLCIKLAWLHGILSGNEGAVTIHLTVSQKKADFSICATTSDSSVCGVALSDKSYPIYPHKDKYQDSVEYSYTYAPVVNALKSVRYATATDEIRLVMTGVYFDDQEDGTTNLVATDGRILALKTVRAAKQYERFSGIISKTLIGFLSQIVADTLTIALLCETKEDGTLLSSNHIIISCGGYDIYTDLLEGRYPNYKGVMVSDLSHNNLARVSRANLNSALKKASNYCNYASGLYAIRFLEEGIVKIFGQDIDSDSSIYDSMPAFIKAGYNAASNMWMNANVTLGMSNVFTLKALSHIGGNMISIYYRDPSQPIVLTGTDENLYTLLMPMVLDGLNPDEICGELKDEPLPTEEEPEEPEEDEQEVSEEEEPEEDEQEVSEEEEPEEVG